MVRVVQINHATENQLMLAQEKIVRCESFDNRNQPVVMEQDGAKYADLGTLVPR